MLLSEIIRGGVSRSGTVYAVLENLSMTPEEIQEINARRSAEQAQQAKDDKDAIFDEALAAVSENRLSIYQASKQYAVNRTTLTAHHLAVAEGKSRPKVGRPKGSKSANPLGI